MQDLGLARRARCPVATAAAIRWMAKNMRSTKRLHAFRNKEQQECLIESVRNNLVPAFTKQGFVVAPPIRRSPVDREFEQSFPSWGRLIRTREAGVDLVQIQLAKYRRTAFRISAGVAPRAGLMTPQGHRPAEEVAVHWLGEYFETHARPWLRPVLAAVGLEPLGAWFSVWPSRSPAQDDYDKLARRAATVVPEVERALREGKSGPHIRRVVIPRTTRPQGETNGSL